MALSQNVVINFLTKFDKKGLERATKELKGFDKVVATLFACKEIWKDSVRMTGSYIIGLPHDTEYNINKVMDFFSADDCPLHSIEFDPLYVQNPQLDLNPWKSEYSVNASKHGFTFDDSLLNWTNEKSPYKNFKNC